MSNQYERDYYNFLQSLRDNELNLQERQREKLRKRKLRHLSRLLTALLHLSKSDAEFFYKQHCAPVSEWKPITDFLFPTSCRRRHA